MPRRIEGGAEPIIVVAVAGNGDYLKTVEHEEDLPKVKLEMVLPSEGSDEVLRAPGDAARTGKIGDGKIIIFDVAEAVRTRNGYRGEAAL